MHMRGTDMQAKLAYTKKLKILSSMVFIDLHRPDDEMGRRGSYFVIDHAQNRP